MSGFQSNAFQTTSFQQTHSIADAFQSNAFQTTGFQTSGTVRASVNVIGPGAGYGKRRKPIDGRVRLLSELDKPLFTPEEILEAPPAYNVDEETRATIEAQVLAAFGDVMDKATRQALQQQQYAALLAREQQLLDDDETFLLM